MRPLHVRPATPADVDRLVLVVNAAFAVERFFVDRDRTDADSVRALFARGDWLVGEDETSRITCCVYTECRGDRGYFGMLSVAPDHQGRGYGRTLINAVESRVRAAGCRAVDIRVVNLRTELPPLYRRLGSVETGVEPFDDPRALRACHFVLMSKPLRRDLR